MQAPTEPVIVKNSFGQAESICFEGNLTLLKDVGLVWTNIEPDNFMIVNRDNIHDSPVVVFEFMAMYSKSRNLLEKDRGA